MATLMTIRPRFYNNDGTVASGGKLYTYAAGTTTPLTTYTTAAASVANTNPIILDSKGEADIWVTGVLKVNLLQSNDVQVTGFPIDNINFPSVTMWNDRGNFDASVNTYPTTGGSGVGNAIVTGDVWTISVVATSGPLNGQLLGTTVRALVDTPGQTGANWSILDVGLGASNAAAVAAAAAAAVSETNAATSASNASTSATNASNSASSASSSAASALAYAQAMSLNATTDTSSSSVAIGTGSKTFTVTAGKSFVPGMFLVIADTAAPSTNSMYGQITSYSGTTLVVNVLSVLGSGTKTAWTISQTSAANLNVDTATTALNTTNTNGQIPFPATQNPSADPNTLDDYEESTWNPTLSGITITGSNLSNYSYTKIGRVVYVYIKVYGSTSVNCSANGTITLPFTPSSLFAGVAVHGGTNFINYTFSSTDKVIFPVGTSGDTTDITLNLFYFV